MSSESALQNRNWAKTQTITFYSFVSSVALMLFFGKLLSFIPDNTDWEHLKSVMLESCVASCMPEKAETLTYYFLTILFPLSFVCIYILLNKVIPENNKLVSKQACSLTSSAVITAVILVFLLVLLSSATPYDTLFSRYGNGCEPWLYGLMTLIILYPVYLGQRLNKNKALKVLFWVSACVFILFIFIRLKSKNMLLTGNYSLTHHFYAWWYPVYRVFSGQTIMVDFESIYGFYPYIVVYALRFLGEVDQRTCALFIALCSAFLCLCLYAFSYVFIKNKVLGFLAATGACVIGPAKSLYDGDIYLQYFPTRALFPITVIAMIAINYKLKGKLCTAHKWLMCLVCAFAIFWNIESGMVAAVIWAGYLILEKALDYDLKSAKLWGRVVTAVLSSVVSVAIAFAAIEIITKLKSGSFIGISEVLFGIIAFAGTGFYMIPIEFGVWILFIIAFMVALVYPLRNLKFVRGDNSLENRTQLVGLFVAGITGIGAFSYFLGRSYPTNVLAIMYPVVLIAAMLFERFFADTKYIAKSTVRNGALNSDSGALMLSGVLKQAVCLVMIGFVCLQSVVLISNNKEKTDGSYDYDISAVTAENNPLVNLTAAVNTWAVKNNNGETPELYIYWNTAVHEMKLEKSHEAVCEQIDWFYKENVHSYIDAVNNNFKPFAIDASGVYNLEHYYNDEWQDILKAYSLSEVFEWTDLTGDIELIYFYTPNK